MSLFEGFGGSMLIVVIGVGIFFLITWLWKLWADRNLEGLGNE